MGSDSRFTKKAATVAASSALCAGVLAACGNPTAVSTGSGSVGSSLPSHSAGANLEGVTLTVWESNSLTPGYKALFTAFEKATGAKLDQVVFPDPFESNLLTKWATGARPDLMVFQSAVDYLQQLNPAKNLLDLTGQPYISKELFHQPWVLPSRSGGPTSNSASPARREQPTPISHRTARRRMTQTLARSVDEP